MFLDLSHVIMGIDWGHNTTLNTTLICLIVGEFAQRKIIYEWESLKRLRANTNSLGISTVLALIQQIHMAIEIILDFEHQNTLLMCLYLIQRVLNWLPGKENIKNLANDYWTISILIFVKHILDKSFPSVVC